MTAGPCAEFTPWGGELVLTPWHRCCTRGPSPQKNPIPPQPLALAQSKATATSKTSPASSQPHRKGFPAILLASP